MQNLILADGMDIHLDRFQGHLLDHVYLRFRNALKRYKYYLEII